MKNLKVKMDEYFGLEGCVNSQLWFYGFFGFGGMVAVISLVAKIQLMFI